MEELEGLSLCDIIPIDEMGEIQKTNCKCIETGEISIHRTNKDLWEYEN